MKIYSSKEFGKAIKERRKELGYTQAQIAAVTGFSISFISDLERGKKTAELEKAILLANTVGMDLTIQSRG